MVLSTGCGNYGQCRMEGSTIATVVMQWIFNTRIRFVLKVPQVEDTAGVTTDYVPIIVTRVELDSLIGVHVPLEEHGRG